MNERNGKILILADDLTGSLDTGVQMTAKGYDVTVQTENTGIPADIRCDVLVINTDTRHTDSTDAYQTVSDLVKDALCAGFDCIYKKTDSGLRGNVGAELTALLEASGEKKLPFVPAWPKMNRITKEGIHYVSGRPLAESIFAKDVLNPVKESRVDRLIHLQSSAAVSLQADNTDKEGIAVYDCISDTDMERIAAEIFNDCHRPLIAAGCAGLLEKYPGSTEKKDSKFYEELPHELIVLSGSLNEVTLKQLQAAQENDACRMHLPVQKILTGQWQEKDIEQFVRSFLDETAPIAIIDTIGDHVSVKDAGEKIAAAMGKIAACLAGLKANRTLMIIGGDTLLGCVKALGIETLTPVKEMAPGTVLAKYTYPGGKGYLITKSGGFGDEALLVQLQKELEESRR